MQRFGVKPTSRRRRLAVVLGIPVAAVLLAAGLLVANGGARLLFPSAAKATVGARERSAPTLNVLEQRAFPATDPNTLKLASYRGAKLVLFFYEMSG